MKREELNEIRRKWFSEHYPYRLVRFDEFDYSILNQILWLTTAGKNSKKYNECIIMLDTETSKKRPAEIWDNHIVAWTISIRAFNQNIATIYGSRPSEVIRCLDEMHRELNGDTTYIYVHNLAYDWVFLRKFLLEAYGRPCKQLNTKAHFPIYIEFKNGFVFRDSLILSQRSLDKWAKDLDVEHQKATGFWDYDKVRNQGCAFTDDELTYIEHDTLAGVECIQKTMDVLHKRIYSMPWTATGIPREEVRNRAKQNRGHDRFLKVCLDYDLQIIAETVYHGGYTHGNRHYEEMNIRGLIQCYDFASSYPFVMLSEKYPMERFTPMKNRSIEQIVADRDNNAYMFRLIMINPRLKDYYYPMPALQFSKCTKCVNPVLDNGRVLCADYAEIWITEMDAAVILNQYIWDKHLCDNVYASAKAYLPRWFTDYVFELFRDKTMLKGGDPVQYAMAKAKLNSLYGMCVQKPVKDNIIEDYETGDYETEEVIGEEAYEKWKKNYNQVLPYQWGIWVTAYAFYNLFQLGTCAGTWLYSDTDSCYGADWDTEKLEAYNTGCKNKLLDNGYQSVCREGREYWLGVAEHDGDYSEFRVIGAKRYCGRSCEDGNLHITVAGVPKKGAECLKDDISNFTKGLIFPGSITGKKTHTYIYNEEIYIDKWGNETGDSVDLSPCDYLLNNLEQNPEWIQLITEEVEIPYFE